MYYRAESLTSVGGALISGANQRVYGLSQAFFRSRRRQGLSALQSIQRVLSGRSLFLPG